RMIVDSAAVAVGDVALVGARNLDPPEEDFLASSGIHTGSEGIGAAIEGTACTYVALDCDVVEPTELTVFMPEPEGMLLRDLEQDANLWVCRQCGHHFPMKALARMASLVDDGSFVEEETDVRSEDPLSFFDLRPYAERLAEAELTTGLGEAMVIGQAQVERT